MTDIASVSPDVPEFLEIVDLGVLGLFGAEGRIAARPADAGLVFPLGLLRQGEKGFGS